MTKSYDERCYDLAGVFLGDEDGAAAWPAEKFGKNKHELALHIQEAIESWLDSKRRRAVQAEINGNPEYRPGSCAHCGEFHSDVCDAMKAAMAGEV